MLFPTSTVQRSTDPSHISWSKGRDAPATFPRVSSLRLVSDTIPWVLNVEARDIGIGVTCGDVIDSIGQQLVKFSDKRDYERLTRGLRQEVGEAYRRNRSRNPDVPGGRLGHGLKRLDFLRQDTMFAGIEVDDRVVKRLCGDALPCVFVLKCSKILEVEDRDARLRSNSRPRASSSTRISVAPPPKMDSHDDDSKILHPTKQEVEDRDARLQSNSRSRSRASSSTRNNVRPPSTTGPPPLPSTPWGGFSSFGNYGPPPPQTDPLPLPSPLPSTPWGRLPSSFGNYGPPPPQTGPLPFSSPLPSTPWGGFPSFGNYGPPPRMGNMPPPQHFGQQPFRAPPEPLSQIFDRLDPFMEGRSCKSICFFLFLITQRLDFD